MPEIETGAVQWFPGHMAKTRRQIKESLPMVDAVVELRDARIPNASTNPELSALIGAKPRLVLLNKADLADPAATERWVAAYRAQGITALAVDCRSGRGLQRFRPAAETLLAQTRRKNAEKGMAGKSAAKVEDRAGVTRHNKWYVIGGGMELLDTPGVLWPKFEDPAVGVKLAFTGGVKDQILDIETLAMRLLETLARYYPDRLAERYKLPEGFASLPPYELLTQVARKRGMLISGGEADTERAAVMLFDELRGGKLGAITFERPEEGT